MYVCLTGNSTRVSLSSAEKKEISLIPFLQIFMVIPSILMEFGPNDKIYIQCLKKI